MAYLIFCKRDGWWEITMTKDMAEEEADMHYEKTTHSPIYIIPITRMQYAMFRVFAMRQTYAINPYARQRIAKQVARFVRMVGEEELEKYKYI